MTQTIAHVRPSVVLPAFVLFACSLVFSAQTKSKGTEKQQEVPKPAPMKLRTALDRFGGLIGEWRGIGLPKRSSRKGAWTEKAKWEWSFPKGKPARLVLQSPKSKLVQRFELTFDESTQEYVGSTRFFDEQAPRVLRGRMDKKGQALTLTASPEAKQELEKRRVTLRLRSAKRVLLLVERARTERYTRVAEIGYTRSGTSIASRGSSGPECVVTGGTGTISLTYKGKTYYVCCSGCRQAFEDDPEGTLRDYRERLAKRKSERPDGKVGKEG